MDYWNKATVFELHSFTLILLSTPFSSIGVCVCVYVLCSLTALYICVFVNSQMFLLNS